ncbi:MAG: recombinase family protein [Candidatus Nomurabacteria bacterium]
MKAANLEEKVLKEIEDGKYKSCYLMYNRRSTDDADNQKNSLEYQLAENTRFTKREKLLLATVTIKGLFTNGIVSEKHSSFKEDDVMIFNSDGSITFAIERPKFYKMVEFLNKGLFKGVIFLSWDRASRNGIDTNVIKKLIKNGVDVRFSMAKYEKSSSGSLHMDIDGVFSEHHSRVTSEKVSLALGKNRESGLCSYQAPVGYLNEGNVNWKPFDPVRAPFIKRFFELADEGWSLADIAKWANEEGFTMPPRRKRRTRTEIESDECDSLDDGREKVSHPLRYTTIQPILRNRFYIGFFLGDNKEWIKSNSHDALVSAELFERVDTKLKKKNKSKHYDKPLDYAFRGIFICEACSRSYNPYPKKGILYCALKCKVDCENTNKNFNVKKFLSEKVKPLIENFAFTEQELEEFEIRLGKDIGKLEGKRLKEIESKERRKKKLREDLAYLRENKVTLLKSGAYQPEELKNEQDKLEEQISTLMIDEQVSEEAMRETLKDVATISELLKDIAVRWDFADLYEKDEITKILFSELSIFDNELKYKLNTGFKPFENRFVAICAQERT